MLGLDVTDDELTLKVGMDLKQYSVTDNLSIPSRIIINRPQEKLARSIKTYIWQNPVVKK